jgi:hypothetical protein
MALRRRLLTPLPQVSIWVYVDWRASEAGHGIGVMGADLAAAPSAIRSWGGGDAIGLEVEQ